MKHIDFSAVLLLTGGLVAMANLFLYCFFGKVATDSYQEILVCLFASNWPELPVHLQKYLIIVIANAQRPLRYHGFGFAFLDLETFSKLIRAVVTYYMAFKTVTTE